MAKRREDTTKVSPRKTDLAKDGDTELPSQPDMPLFIASDQGGRTVWRLSDGRRPPLGDIQIVGLAAKFGLSARGVGELAASLARSLDPLQSPLLLEVSRSEATSRGERAFEAAIQETLKAKWKILDALVRLEALRPSHRPSELKRVVLQLNRVHQQLRDCGEALKRLSDDEFIHLTAGDAHQGASARRRVILREIFSFWEGIGRKLTFTTDPVTSERRGPLVDFVNAVVACVTDPPTRLGGETIIAEIKAYRDAKRRRKVV